jgi:hypothetical protein
VQETFIERKKREYVINPDVDYPDPEYVIEIGGTPTLPKGNLIALSAKWKNGKTFLCDVLTAVFLGSERFAGCRTLFSQGKVSFYDTEQAESDTSRIRKVIDAMTPEGRRHDYDVYCLRPLNIDPTSEDSDEITRYEFISERLVALWPETGRTHQLRIHCPHPDGSNNPIVGDELYGTKGQRLCLHAAEIWFKHPITGQAMHFEITPDFV